MYERYDWFSKIVHVSIFGVAGHFKYPDDEEEHSIRFDLTFFDLPPDHSIISALYTILDSQKRILSLFGDMLKPYTDGRITEWLVRFNSVEAKLDVHRGRWNVVVPNPQAVRDLPMAAPTAGHETSS